MIAHPTTTTAFNRLARRQVHVGLASAAGAHARGRLVDIGCGTKPYTAMFAPYVDEHVGVDHPDSPHALTSVDVLASAYDVPLEDAGFDTALMSEVLEHLEDPERGLREAFRLLRPGGTLILTTPFMWVLHEEPRDFFRYSPHGLRYLLGRAGFHDVHVTPLSGQWGTLGIFASYALRRSPAARFRRTLPWVVLGIQRLAERADRAHFRPWMSWNHLVVAHKHP